MTYLFQLKLQTHSRLRADAQVLSLSQSQFPQPQRVGKRQREENHIVMSDESKGRAKQLAERISVAQDEQDEKEEQPNKHPKSEAPNTGSLHALLIQALKSDSSLLESCLAVRDVVVSIKLLFCRDTNLNKLHLIVGGASEKGSFTLKILISLNNGLNSLEIILNCVFMGFFFFSSPVDHR